MMTELVIRGVQVQSIVSDPPYGIGFMSRDWDDPDNIAFRCGVWRLCLQLLPPGGHLVVFGATRTYHRLVTAIEAAGFEIRDTISWIHAQGFPKSHDVSKAIDKKLGSERPIIGITAATSPDAQEWAGYGTQLKPAQELICLARKPLQTTVADCVLKHRTGALNINGCRIVLGPSDPLFRGVQHDGHQMSDDGSRGFRPVDRAPGIGRWPANVIHDGSNEILRDFPQSKGQQGDVKGDEPSHIGDNGIYGRYEKTGEPFRKRGDTGSTARFYFCAKASKRERRGSKHKTIKPLSLMRWLVRLVTPPGGVVLDPFAGTGTTGEAAMLEGCDYLLIERNPVYVEEIMKRIPEPERMAMGRRRMVWRVWRVWLSYANHRAVLDEPT